MSFNERLHNAGASTELMSPVNDGKSLSKEYATVLRFGPEQSASKNSKEFQGPRGDSMKVTSCSVDVQIHKRSDSTEGLPGVQQLSSG